MITLYVDGYFVNWLDASCLITLEEKQLEYQTARALLRDGQGVPAPLGNLAIISRVPALQHGNFYLTESLAILEYLEDTFPTPRILPADPQTRARARQLMAYLRFDLHTLREERSWWMCVYPADPPPLTPKAQREIDELLVIADRVIGDLGEFSIAHADLALTLLRLARTRYPLPDSIARFVDATIARPSVRAYVDHPRPPNPPPRFVSLG